MKRAILMSIAAMLTLSVSALADVKIKSKQTVSGQSSENVTYIKGKRQRIEMSGGSLISITQCDLSRDLQLNPQTKTYMVNLYDDGTTSDPKSIPAGAKAPVTKGGTMFVTTTTRDTGERKQMFGFTARHIVQTMETESSPDACQTVKSKMEIDMWVIDAEFGLVCSQTRTYRPHYNGTNGGCQDKYVTKALGSGKTGYPLWQKMTSFDANGKESFTMTQEVTEISKAVLDAGLFEAPGEYRQVKDTSEMYASMSAGVNTGSQGKTDAYKASSGSSSAFGASIKSASTDRSDSVELGAKKPGTVRLGIPVVKTGSVGEGISPADLSAAIKNSLGEFLKGTKVEIIALDARLPAAQNDEARQKECDFIVYANVSHKKGGGGGFGFGKMLAQTVGQTGIGHTGSTAGNIAGQMATTAIVTAGSVSGNVKNKDEVTLDLKLQSTADAGTPLAKSFKQKAKSDGDDIISAVVELAAQAILDAVS